MTTLAWQQRWWPRLLLSLTAVALLAGAAEAAGTAAATANGVQAATGDCGFGQPGGSNGGVGGANGGVQECGDTTAILHWVMSLPGGGGTTSTGPGGAIVPGAPGGPETAAPPVFGALPTLIAGQFRPNEVLVVLQPGATTDIAAALARDYALQLEVFTPSRSLRTALVRFRIPDARTVAAVVAALARDPRVRASQPNFIYRPAADAAPAQTGGLPQYALDLTGSRTAAARVAGARRPVVAVIDTGIDETHPDLGGAVRGRFDAVADGHWDVGTHGTGIAGIIAARGQLQGVDPQAALLSVRAFSGIEGAAGGEATSLAVLRGLDWSLEQSADVVNMSFAGPPDPVVDAAVGEVLKAGTIVVAAAGNGGPGAPPAYPAAVPGVIAVTATDEHDKVFSGANRGTYISLAAPGVDVLSATPGGGYDLATGTSQAAAMVSGVVALLRASRKDLTPQAALDVLGRTAKDMGPPGRDADSGAGRLDAAAALDALGPAQQAGQ